MGSGFTLPSLGERLWTSNDNKHHILGLHSLSIHSRVALKSRGYLLHFLYYHILSDRPDLRFLAVPITTVPQTPEGDYFHVDEADLLEEPTFGVSLGREVGTVERGNWLRYWYSKGYREVA